MYVCVYECVSMGVAVYMCEYIVYCGYGCVSGSLSFSPMGEWGFPRQSPPLLCGSCSHHF